MPLYEYECQGCGKVFTAALTLGEHDRIEIRCPSCDSRDVRQLMSAFTAHTDKKT